MLYTCIVDHGSCLQLHLMWTYLHKSWKLDWSTGLINDLVSLLNTCCVPLFPAHYFLHCVNFLVAVYYLLLGVEDKRIGENGALQEETTFTITQ